MGLRINTNVASIRAQNALYKSTRSLQTAMTRLSTGLRINTGADDVVGLAKSEALRTRIRGIDAARANISASSAVLGVAEGYLSELTEIAHQVREIAVSASDDTISATDRGSLKAKFDSLLSEYNRLADRANFNGVKLLDGTFTNKIVQVGTDEGDTIAVNVGDARSASIGRVAIYTALSRNDYYTSSTGAFTSLDLTDPSGISIAGITLTSSDFSDDGVSTADSDESALAYVNAINSIAGRTGVRAETIANAVTFNYSNGVTINSSATIVINGFTIKTSGFSMDTTDDDDVASMVDLVNEYSLQTGVVAEQDASSNTLTFTASDGRNIAIGVFGEADGATATTNAFGMMTASTDRSVVFKGTFKLISDEAFTISGASAEFTSSNSESVSISSTTSFSNATVNTASNASVALSIMDNVIRQLQSRRATIGSAINRFETSESELTARLENLSAADSSIREADLAEETAKVTQARILQQAGVAVLGQANTTPQIALSLLQGLGG